MRQIAAEGSDHAPREASQKSRTTTARGATGGLLVLMIEDSSTTTFGVVPEGEIATSTRRSGPRR
jgi:hypothetical protein